MMSGGDVTPDELAAFSECDAWIAAGCPDAKTHEEFMAELGRAIAVAGWA